MCSVRNMDVVCPSCSKAHPIEVEIVDPPQNIKLVVQEDTARVNELAARLGEVADQVSESQRTVDALQGDLQRWQSGENHLQAQDMLRMLQTCPNCRPALDGFVGEVRKQAIRDLDADQVKELARKHRLWPPPPLYLPDGLLSKRVRQ